MYNDDYNDKSYRNVFLIERLERNIEEDKKDLAKNTALLGASALAVGIGTLGLILIGNDIINAFNSEEALTLGSYLLVRFQDSGIAVSGSIVACGIITATSNAQNTMSSLRRLKYNKKRLEEEKGRSK